MDSSVINNIIDKTIPEHFMNVFETQEYELTSPETNSKYNPYFRETDEKREARLAANRERMRNMRLNETPEQREARQAYNRIRARLNLIRETEEERQKRLASNRERMKANREKYSEQRRRMRALETPERREKRLLANRERNRNARLYETPEQKERRRADNRERQRLRRAQETPEEVEMRRSYNRARMSLKRSIKKYKAEENDTEISQTHETVNYGSEPEVDVDLDYVIPDVVINMVDEADSKDKHIPNLNNFVNTLNTFTNDINGIDAKPMDLFMSKNSFENIEQPTISDYIQKCITTIDNILNSDSYQHINTEQQQTITDTAMGRRTQLHQNLLPINIQPGNEVLPTVIHTTCNINPDKKYSYN